MKRAHLIPAAFLVLIATAQLHAQNLAAVWHLDEGAGTTVSDSSGNGNTGCFPSIVNVTTCFGVLPAGVDDPAWTGAAAAKFGNSALASDADDLVFVPSSPSLSPTAAVTLEAWVKVGASTGATMSILRKLGGAVIPSPLRSYALYLFFSGGGYNPSFEIDDPVAGPETVGGGSISPSDGRWHHLAGTYDGAALKMYVDGILVGTHVFAGSINSNGTPVQIGRKFNGNIDEARIWSRALTAGEILTSAQAGLHGLWHLDSLAAGLTPDASGYNNNGTFSSTSADASPLVASTVGTGFGNALSMDGDDSVDAGNDATLHVSANDFTVDAWVQFNSLSGDQSIVDKMKAGGPNFDGWRLLKQANNDIWFCFGGGGNGCFTGASTTVESTNFGTVTTGTWYHVAGVKTAKSISVYVNGVKTTNGSFSAFTDTNATGLLFGHNAGEGAHLDGKIDEIHVWQRALSDTEIAYLAGVTNTSPEGGGDADQSRAPLVLPGTIGEALGLGGVIGPTDWSLAGTSPGMALGFWVAFDGGTPLDGLTLREHGFESTPRGSCGDLFGRVLSPSGAVGLITAANNTGCGRPASTVHFEGDLTGGGDIGLNIHWP